MKSSFSDLGKMGFLVKSGFSVLGKVGFLIQSNFFRFVKNEFL
jgi:hypothetical protein